MRLSTDSSAAKGAALRTGCGRLKHIQICQLWVQERVAAGEVEIRKVGRELNMSDLCTHHWNVKEGRNHLGRMGVEIATVA